MIYRRNAAGPYMDEHAIFDGECESRFFLDSRSTFKHKELVYQLEKRKLADYRERVQC